MNTRAAAVLMIAGIGLLAAAIPRTRTRRSAAPRVHRTERPWLTREAEDELIGEHGEPGPLFAGVTLGGPPPSVEQRLAIATFARDHAVDIQLEIKAETLVAIRASITFGGCCGYEAVDVLGRRLSRPNINVRIDDNDYIPGDDWAFEPDPMTHVRFHTHVNTLTVRWEPALTTNELLDTVEGMIGARVSKLAHASGDRMRESDPHDYLLELPYDGPRPPFEGSPQIGVHVSAHAGAVTEVSFEVIGDPPEDVECAPVEKVLRARYGRPHVDAETGELTWHRNGHVIVAEISSYSERASVTIARDVPQS